MLTTVRPINRNKMLLFAGGELKGGTYEANSRGKLTHLRIQLRARIVPFHTESIGRLSSVDEAHICRIYRVDETVLLRDLFRWPGLSSGQTQGC